MPLLRRAATAALAAALVLGPFADAATAVPTAPTASASSAKAVSIRSWAAHQWGTFATWTRSGTGDDVLTIPRSITAAVVRVQHDGESNFAVWTLDRSNEHTDLLVNEIGPYAATRLFGLEEKGRVRGLEINADGNWTVTLKPVSTAPALPRSGAGAGVYLLGSHRAARFTHDGESNFAVWQHRGGRWGRDLLINDIGAYAGTVRLDRGRSVIEIEADGSWTANPR